MEFNQYKPPVRTSLSDAELAARVDYATSTKMGLEAMMDLVVAQEALRAQEDREIADWLAQMDAEGSAESLRAAEDYRRAQSGTQEAQPAVDHEVATVHDVQNDKQVQSEPEIDQTPLSSFSWFTQPEPIEPDSEPSELEAAEPELVASEDESIVTDENVVLVEESLEAVIVDAADEVILHTELEEDVSKPEPVGSESIDEFEHLLASAAAEEELTALEESAARVPEEIEQEVAVSANITVPSEEHRDRKPISQLLVWLGASATVIPVFLTWFLITLGLNATAIVFDLGLGYLVSGLVIATVSLAGKRSGLATSTVARAVFGVWGNIVPLKLSLLVRIISIVWLAALTQYFLTKGDSPFVSDSTVSHLGTFDLTTSLTLVSAVILLAAIVSAIRGRASRFAQVLLSLGTSAVFCVSVLGMLTSKLSLTAPGSMDFTSRESILGLSSVIMVSTTLFVSLSTNIAKAIPMRERGLRVFSWVAVANLLAPLAVSVLALAWLGPRAKQLASIMTLDLSSVQTIIWELPAYSRISLVAAIVLTLGYVLMLSFKTAALDLESLLPIKSRVATILLTLVYVFVFLALVSVQPANQLYEYLLNLFVLAAFLSSGWIGMFVTDIALRRIAYHELSLNRSYGFYKRFSWSALSIWVICIAAASALIPVNLQGLNFTGFAVEKLGLSHNLTAAPVGFALVLLLGIVLTIIVRIPEIRKQEREVLQVEARRDQLNNIFLGQE